MTTRNGEKEAVLCYVEEPWAWFTTAPLTVQWGDDWNDAPYEHNAGSPYEWHPYMEQRGIEPYVLLRVAYTGDYEAPRDGHHNSPWSVQAINEGRIPWLSTSRWRSDARQWVKAGTSLDDFEAFLSATSGTLYLPTWSVDDLARTARNVEPDNG